MKLQVLLVTFEWNVLLDLSGEAATKTFGSLVAKLLLQVLSQSTRAVAVGIIRGDEGVGDFPGVRGVQGDLQVLRNLDLIDTRTQT